MAIERSCFGPESRVVPFRARAFKALTLVRNRCSENSAIDVSYPEDTLGQSCPLMLVIQARLMEAISRPHH